MVATRSLPTLLVILLFSISALANPLIVDTILEGEEVVIPSSITEYHLKLVTVPDTTRRAVFSLNGEYSRALRPRERYTFSDGSILAIGNILPNEGKETKGKDLVEFYFVGSDAIITPRFTLRDELTPIEYDLTSLDQEQVPTTSLGNVLNKLAITDIPNKHKTLDPTSLKDTCTSDEDCEDANGCTTDTCMGTPRICRHQSTTLGCSFGTRYCIPYYRSYIIPPDSGVYCSIDGTWVEQKKDQLACTGDFECLGGFCKSKQCATQPGIEKPSELSDVGYTPLVNPSPKSKFWQEIYSFFKKIFSFL